jgi:hypothetical protein
MYVLIGILQREIGSLRGTAKIGNCGETRALAP